MSASNLHRHTLVKKAQDSQAQATSNNTPPKPTRPPRISTYPPAPPERYADHALFYGIYVDKQWLIDHMRRTTPLDESLPESTKAFRAMQHLTSQIQRKTGLRNLTYEPVVIDKDTPPNAVISEGRTGNKSHLILCLCEWDRYSWRRRPTLEQVATISRIMDSRPPRWWIDVRSPESYD